MHITEVGYKLVILLRSVHVPELLDRTGSLIKQGLELLSLEMFAKLRSI